MLTIKYTLSTEKKTDFLNFNSNNLDVINKVIWNLKN